MNIHSRYLIHWTGKKDIEEQPENIRAQKYVERVIDYYQNGLYAKRTSEDVVRGMKINNLARLCFTEIRLSQAQEHANRYGKLGIGFSREFILNKGGRPVIYIPFEAKEHLLEDSLKAAYDKSEAYDEIHKPLKWVLAFVKRMSNEYDQDHEDYENYYDEMEWRIVYDEKPDNNLFTKGKAEGVFRLMFVPSDIKVLIFPNDYVKSITLNNEFLKGLFSQNLPITVTLDDCNNF